MRPHRETGVIMQAGMIAQEAKKAELLAKGQQIKLVACDLDGTLLNKQGWLSPATLDLPQKLAAKGILLTLSSGRIHTMLGTICEAMKITCPIISCNGGTVIHPQTGEVLLHQGLDRQSAEAILALGLQHKLELSILSPTLNLFTANSQRWQNFIRYNEKAAAMALPEMQIKRWAEDISYEEALLDLRQVEVSKVLCREPGSALPLLQALVADFPALALTQSSAELYELIPAHISKGKALLTLAQRLGIQQHQIMAFGDYENDRSMLEAAGFAVAMENASPGIKAIADYVTGHHDQDGVVKALERFVL